MSGDGIDIAHERDQFEELRRRLTDISAELKELNEKLRHDYSVQQDEVRKPRKKTHKSRS